MTARTPKLTEQQYQLLSNEGWGTGPVDSDVQVLADLGLVDVSTCEMDGCLAWSWGPTEAGARLGPYPHRYGQPSIAGEA